MPSRLCSKGLWVRNTLSRWSSCRRIQAIGTLIAVVGHKAGGGQAVQHAHAPDKFVRKIAYRSAAERCIIRLEADA